jgi:hypothetical protein
MICMDGNIMKILFQNEPPKNWSLNKDNDINS